MGAFDPALVTGVVTAAGPRGFEVDGVAIGNGAGVRAKRAAVAEPVRVGQRVSVRGRTARDGTIVARRVQRR